MPYGDYKNDPHFQKGLGLTLPPGLKTVEDIASYLINEYGDSAGTILLGYACRRIAEEGFVLEGGVILQETGLSEIISKNRKLKKLLNNVYSAGEKTQKRINSESMILIKNQEKDDFGTENI